MKCIIQAMVVAALFTGMQAWAEDGPIVLPSRSTYADRHAADIARTPLVSAFPGGNGDPIVLPSRSTYIDRHAADIAQAPWGNVFPSSSPD